jgi:hypothetical protein
MGKLPAKEAAAPVKKETPVTIPMPQQAVPPAEKATELVVPAVQQKTEVAVPAEQKQTQAAPVVPAEKKAE